MNNFWKISTIVLTLVCLGMAYLLYNKGKKPFDNNIVSIKDIDRESFEYKKKQDASFAKDMNDYFFKNPTKIRFLQDLYDLDTIASGKTIYQKIQYVNEGKNPYFITDVRVSCGCTVPSYDHEPIKSGDTGSVMIQFNSTGKEGFSMNKLTLLGNTEPTDISVYFKLFILKK